MKKIVYWVLGILAVWLLFLLFVGLSHVVYGQPGYSDASPEKRLWTVIVIMAGEPPTPAWFREKCQADGGVLQKPEQGLIRVTQSGRLYKQYTLHCKMKPKKSEPPKKVV